MTQAVRFLETITKIAQEATNKKVAALKRIHGDRGIQLSSESAAAGEADDDIKSVESMIEQVKKGPACASTAPSTNSSVRSSAAGFSMRRLDGSQPEVANEKRRWIGAFPRALLARERRLHVEHAVLRLPPQGLAASTTPNFPRAPGPCSLEFKSELEVNHYQDLIATRPDGMKWFNPGASAHRQIESRRDMPLDVRARQRACSHRFAMLREMLYSASFHMQATMLGAHGCKGMVNLCGDADRGEIWETTHTRGN
ncbi:unnamed protein product [Prorocentrum cordatum]|uniref:Uncharacterized protein n=1 Tax=Prorocentrum cordatum TaxID=2364126 RepID=A0ABN9PPJ7_9DINO|nr:unnamed protein product [Polarella glacialis]